MIHGRVGSEKLGVKLSYVATNLADSNVNFAYEDGQLLVNLQEPADRTEEELEVICNRLRSIDAFDKYHPSLLQQMCYFGYYEDLDKGVTLFRQGDKGTNWYAVLAGSLDVQVIQTAPDQRSVIEMSIAILLNQLPLRRYNSNFIPTQTSYIIPMKDNKDSNNPCTNTEHLLNWGKNSDHNRHAAKHLEGNFAKITLTLTMHSRLSYPLRHSI
ncbi:rap guanine nucleotide exchange factor 4 [Trichonephila clavata]|uniref:Rap guanine nucleotide exchange factor 4 n=1 Tax=Trichonephila clavata TaxID=2740835 RepID=A0A8X6I248_TRICU|nr:rap guanine nucleotide exchange factor 4 [Trichonephila clavata]